MAELALAALTAGGAVYSGVTQAKNAKAMRAAQDREEKRVAAMEDGMRKVRLGGRGMLAFSEGEEGLGQTMGGADKATSSTFGRMGA